MRTPHVAELPLTLEAVTPDPFIADLTALVSDVGQVAATAVRSRSAPEVSRPSASRADSAWLTWGTRAVVPVGITRVDRSREAVRDGHLACRHPNRRSE